VAEWQDRQHRRFNPLTREWVLVSPHRTDRPWMGERVAASPQSVPSYDPSCYLCPGNVRANGQHNPPYTSTFVFINDFAALLAEAPEERSPEHPLLTARAERGECRVICFSPRHDLHLASMPVDEIAGIVDCWAEQFTELSQRPYVRAVTIFENRGAMMGASNPHPHGQVWAESSLPNELVQETAALEAYARAEGHCLLCSYAALEAQRGERIVYRNEHFLAVVPFWAVWPYEVLLLGTAHHAALCDLAAEERAALAEAIGSLTARYDRLFGVPFPYTMGFHQRPCNDGPHRGWHLHAHYYPPLLRSATIRKYMVGYEMLAQPQRDLTAEQAAAHLRDA
jgi:UDPglucose--hexose-1-phosphate uridylyltransferase